MKTFTYFLSLSLLFTITACRNKSPKPQPVASAKQLPPYTETGANTFGCLINGEVFIPGKPAFSSYTTLQCTYQYVNGSVYFSLAAGNFQVIENRTVSKGVSFHCSNMAIDKGIYTLSRMVEDSMYATLTDYSNTKRNYYSQPPNALGDLNISHFDTINQIISGTFWFDAIDTTTGKIVHVTEGRFDTHFYR